MMFYSHPDGLLIWDLKSNENLLNILFLKPQLLKGRFDFQADTESPQLGDLGVSTRQYLSHITYVYPQTQPFT